MPRSIKLSYIKVAVDSRGDNEVYGADVSRRKWKRYNKENLKFALKIGKSTLILDVCRLDETLRYLKTLV